MKFFSCGRTFSHQMEARQLIGSGASPSEVLASCMRVRLRVLNRARSTELRRRKDGPMDNDSPSSRGFRPKQQDEATKERLPPGQYVTTEFPVLCKPNSTKMKLADDRFALRRGASRPATWTWAEFEVLPQTTIKNRHSVRYPLLAIHHDTARRDV